MFSKIKITCPRFLLLKFLFFLFRTFHVKTPEVAAEICSIFLNLQYDSWRLSYSIVNLSILASQFNLNMDILRSSIIYNRQQYDTHYRHLSGDVFKLPPNKNDRLWLSFTLNHSVIVFRLLIFHLNISIWLHWHNWNVGNRFQFSATKHFVAYFWKK